MSLGTHHPGRADPRGRRLGGGYYGYRGSYYGPGMYGGIGLVVILLIVLLLFSGIGGWRGPW